MFVRSTVRTAATEPGDPSYADQNPVRSVGPFRIPAGNANRTFRLDEDGLRCISQEHPMFVKLHGALLQA